MCGILGQVKLSNKALKKNFKNFEKSLKLMEHRGPDASGIVYDDKYIFGHRRLKILDMSDNANQPMVSEDGKISIVFNGEIYNFKDIKKELKKKDYKFKTNCDTEIILKSYLQNGIDCIKDFNGMFAFAIFDKRIGKLYLVRDRLGIKPLFYKKLSSELTFSSEIKPLISLKKIKKIININAVSSYMSFRFPILNDTFINNISSLPPAHYIEFGQNSFSINKYWDLASKIKKQEIDMGEKFYIKNIKKLIKSSIKYRMISDVPVGSFLSGGVDSSIITGIMSKLNTKNKVQSFTIGFKEKKFNELKFAKEVSKSFSTKHRNLIIESGNYMKTLEDLIKIKGAPLSVPNEVPLYLMSKELKKHVTVVLSGEGADEIFGGYGRIFRSPYDLDRMKNIDKLNLSDDEKNKLSKNFLKKYTKKIFKDEIDHFMNIYSYTSLDDKKNLLHKDINLDIIEKKFKKLFLEYFNEIKSSSYYTKMMYVFEKIHLVGLLGRLDNSSMAASVEARVPFVDHRLVEFAFTIPIKYKLKWINKKKFDDSLMLMSDQISEENDIPKYILKKSYENLLPRHILYRKKMGFPVPLSDWFGKNLNLRVKNILLSKTAKKRSLYNTNLIKKYLDNNELMTNSKIAMKIWMLVNIEYFCKNYIDN